MDLQKLINAISETSRMERMNYHLTLGGLADALKQADVNMPVVFDCGNSPSEPHSYRGYYSDLCFEQGNPITAGELLEEVTKCFEKTFEGYKGGDFTMSEDTPLWTAPYGDTGRAVMGAHVVDNVLVLLTKEID